MSEESNDYIEGEVIQNDFSVEPGITAKLPEAKKFQIFQAADQLLAEGIHPSINAVRGRLNGGSNSTITKYLKQWREERQAEREQEIKNQRKELILKLPEELKAVMQDALEQQTAMLWDKAKELVAGEIDAIRKEKEEALAKKDRELASQIELTASVQADLEQSAELLDESEARIRALETDNRQLVEDKLELETNQLDLNRRLEESDQRLTDRVEERDQARSERDRLQALKGQAEDQVKVLQGKQVELEESIRDHILTEERIAAKLHDTKDAATKLESETARLNSTLESMKDQSRNSEIELAQAKNLLSLSQGKNVDYESEIKSLRGEILELSKETGSLTREVEMLRGKEEK